MTSTLRREVPSRSDILVALVRRVGATWLMLGVLAGCSESGAAQGAPSGDASTGGEGPTEHVDEAPTRPSDCFEAMACGHWYNYCGDWGPENEEYERRLCAGMGGQGGALALGGAGGEAWGGARGEAR